MMEAYDEWAERNPHACGDEPLTAELAAEIKSVIPTHVGMNRKASIRAVFSLSNPHACGDEPNPQRDVDILDQ